MFSSLFAYIQSVIPISDEEIDLIKPFLSEKKIKKGNLLIRENDICDAVFFIKTGYFRIYINGEFKEITVHLGGPNEFISAFSGFISRSKNHENIQAVTDAEVVFINYNDLHYLYNKSHTLDRLGRLVIEQHFVKKDLRVISLITDSAEIRYNHLIKNNPDFLHHIPLQYIASYLGINPETLSRIRAK